MAEGDTTDPLWVTLDDAELAELMPYGTERTVAAGEVLYRAGDNDYPFFVILEGTASVERAGESIALTTLEFDLLYFLVSRPGRVFSREQLLSRVWGYRYAGGTRTVDIHVRRLRAKLGPGSAMIETVRHVGYKLRAPAGTPG